MLVLGHRFTRCDPNVELHSWGSLHTYGISYLTVCVCVFVFLVSWQVKPRSQGSQYHQKHYLLFVFSRRLKAEHQVRAGRDSLRHTERKERETDSQSSHKGKMSALKGNIRLNYF